MNKQQVAQARDGLIALHKAILDAERVELEQVEGPLVAGAWLQRIVGDARFAWLRPLTELIVRLDELEASETPEDAEACLSAAKTLLTPERLGEEYARLLQVSPAVVLAHAAARRAVGAR